MSIKKSQALSNLMKKVKLVKGYHFITIEDTINLTNHELIKLISLLMEQSFIKSVPYISILVNIKFNDEIDKLLKEFGFTVQEEVIFFHKMLDEPHDIISGYKLQSLENLSIENFKRIWAKSMDGSLNASSSLNIDEQMCSVEMELGPTFRESCIVAYEKEEAIGVIIPHIEPGTVEEGRLFYFGLLPKERGKGKSKLLHQQALSILKNDFKASYYIGSTSNNNIPMCKTLKNNGCTILERNIVYSRRN